MRRKVTIGYLPNGIQVNCMSDKVSFVSGIGANVGAIDDPILKTGFWHLSEHLLARQTRSRSPRDMHLELRKYTGWGIGVDSDLNVRIDPFSIFFGHDFLCYSRDMVSTLTLLAEAYRDRYITLNGLLSEKAAIHTETKIFGYDAILSELDQALYRLIYASNPLRRRIDSEPSEFMKINYPSALLRIVNRYLIPGRTFINIFGPSHAKSLELANRLMGDWKISGEPPVEFESGHPVRDERMVVGYDGSDNFPILNESRSVEIIKPGIAGHYVAIGFPVPKSLKDMEEPLEMMADMIGFEVLESLRTNNVDYNNGAYRVIPTLSISFMHGLMWFWAASSSRGGANIAEEEILKQCRAIAENMVDEAVFEATKYRMLASWNANFLGYTGVLSEAVISFIANGDWSLEKFHGRSQRIKRLSRRKIRNIANKFFAPPQGFNYAKVYIGPEGGSFLFASIGE